MSVKAYYQLAKPGIVYGNALSAIGGFLLASRTRPNWGLFAAMLAGICLVMASGCVVNNYIDRGIDARMKRTRTRALVTGEISPAAAMLYAMLLGATGIGCLLLTNALTLDVALFGFFMYVVAYGYWKRHSSFGTVVGSISGAVPPVVGYCAVTNRFDLGAFILFAVLVAWQMPHFYAIAIYRAKEYAQAHIPVLPLVKGVKKTKWYMLGYIIAFIAATASLTTAGYAGITYLIAMMVIGFLWLWRAVIGMQIEDDERWARSMFGFSLVVLLVFCTAISIDPWLP